MRTPIVLSVLCVSGLVSADRTLNGPLPNPDTRFRTGANHHTGDDGFIAAKGRAPTANDSELERMKLHFLAVRNWLASRPATKPELQGKRDEILGYLDRYIAKGTTPKNEHLPWRVPVFIDDDHTICAVGYLIEQSAGRALPEKIAREHRYEYIDDIAKEMPEVMAWVEKSGFSLEELSHIQPAYSSPTPETWRTWDLVRHAPPDGAFKNELGVAGTFDKHAMHGTWTVTRDETIVGTGTLDHGNGLWKSYYKDGTHLLATGRYRNNVADGAWTIYHQSGNVAATGNFVAGTRAGKWTFYYDTPAKTRFIEGQFTRGGYDTGVWRHFDASGKPLATTYSEGGNVIDVTPDKNGVALRVHSLQEDIMPPVEFKSHRLDRVALGSEKLFVFNSGYAEKDVIYDAAGFKLEHTEQGWTASNCHWSAKRKAIAKGDNVAWLHEMLVKDSRDRGTEKTDTSRMRVEREGGDPGPTCDAAKPVVAARAATLDTMMKTRTTVRQPAPAFLRSLVLGAQDEAETGEADDDVKTDDASASDNVLAIPYLQWAHVDGRFEQVFKTMAGRIKWEWYQSEPEADGTNPNDDPKTKRPPL